MAESDGPSGGRPYRGEDPEIRVSRRRQALVDAGLELFGSRGYRATSVKDLCRHVSLTERYFYESFDNREALLAAVFDHLVSDLDARLREALGHVHGNPPARVRRMLETFFDFTRDEHRARVLLIEILGVSPAIDRRYQKAVRDLAALMEHPSLGLLRGGHRTRKGLHVASIGLVGAITQIATQWVLEDYLTPKTTVNASALRLFEAVAAVAPD